LYDEAAALNQDPNEDPERVIEAYNRFLTKNPKDHRKVPEALYCISSRYLRMGKNRKAKEFFEKAVLSEMPDNRLPCFGRVTIPTKAMLLKLAPYDFGIG